MTRKKSLSKEMGMTRDGVAEMTQWCIQIALHQEFGIGEQRLNRLKACTEELGQQSLAVAMTPGADGMPQTDRSRQLRENWMPEGVDPEFRVPVERAPRTRREQQLRMAGNVAAGMVWTIYAKACRDVLGFSTERLNRLRMYALENYRQVNEEGHRDGLDVAMEHLRRAAQAMLPSTPVSIEEVPDEERLRQTEQDYDAQMAEYRHRLALEVLAKKGSSPGVNVLSSAEMERRIKAVQKGVSL